MTIPYYDWISHHAMRTPQKAASIDLSSGRTFSYLELDRRINAIAAFLRHRHHVERGQTVSVLALNATIMLELQFACARIGAIFCPLNIRLTTPELQAIVDDADPSLLFHDADQAVAAKRLGMSVRGLQLVSLADDGPLEADLLGMPELGETEFLSHDDASTLLYTSGTTGKPKGAIITHGMNFWNAVNISPIAGINPQSVFLNVLPLFHTGGLNCYTNPVLLAGGTVLIMRNFDPELALSVLSERRHGVNLFFGVPSIYQFMEQLPAFEQADLAELTGGVGGAAMPMRLLRRYKARGLAILQAYGMTETGPFVACLGQDDAERKIGSAGKPLLHCELKIVDANGQPVARGHVGEMWVRGPGVSPGYRNRPEVNAASFTDGWLHTGDLLMEDEDGFLFVVDRSKDMYISGGENVYPAEVENVLASMPGVAEAAVVGVPHQKWGETGVAFVVVKAGALVNEADLQALCREKLAGFKRPSTITFLDTMPRTGSGKAHKPRLRKMASESAA